MSKLGWNIQYSRLDSDQKHGLNYYSDRLNSGAFVVINNVDVAKALQERYPLAYVILRIMPQGLPNDDNIHRHMAPFAFVDMYARALPDKRIIIYANNEPHPSDDPALIQWLLDVAKEAVNRGFRVCLGNFSIGTPNENDIRKYDALLRYAGQHKSQVFIGLHEYMLQDWQSHGNWHVGRFNFWLDYCIAAGIPEPDILITEFGYDYIDVNGQRLGGPLHDVIGQLREANYSGETSAARRIVDAYKAHYHNARAVKGVCLFTWGADTDHWLKYDVSVLREFLEYLVAHIPRDRTDATTFVSIPGGALNFRLAPSLTSAVIDKLQVGDVVYLTGRTRSASGYIWFEAAQEGRLSMPGWFARIVNLITSPLLPGTPIDEPIEAPDDGATDKPDNTQDDALNAIKETKRQIREALLDVRKQIDKALQSVGE